MENPSKLVRIFLFNIMGPAGLVALVPVVLCAIGGSWTGALAAGGTGILIFLTMGFIIPRAVRREIQVPLEMLGAAADLWAQERLDIRVDLPMTDEFGQVSGKLNALAERFETIFLKMTVKTRTDLVTGLPSRAQLLLDLTLTTHPVLILGNIDSFKEINDSYGNRAGDEVLRDLADLLNRYRARHPFRIYKMPADEFAILFDQQMDDREIARLPGDLCELVYNARFLVDGQPIPLRVTFGVATGDRSHLLAHADMALKKAKKTLQPYLVFHDSLEIQREYESNLFWKNEVRQAIKDARIVAHYQPITDNLTGKVAKYETLVRLEGADSQLHLPAAFLEVARKSHCDSAITMAMVDQAFNCFADLPFEFSVNLTVKDMLSPEVFRFIMGKVEEQPETARRMVVEILESEGIENYREVKLFLTAVKAAGVKVAIDDFGSGYSNFDHILKLDVDYIKLDASLVRNIDTDLNAQVIVRTIVGFSKELGLKTISEHVHTKEVYETTRTLGVDYSQGFYLGRPGPMGIGSKGDGQPSRGWAP